MEWHRLVQMIYFYHDGESLQLYPIPILLFLESINKLIMTLRGEEEEKHLKIVFPLFICLSFTNACATKTKKSH